MPVSLTVQLINGAHLQVEPACCSHLTHLLYLTLLIFLQIASDVAGLGEHTGDYFFQTPFIFSHRVILHLQRENKDSYHHLLSYVTIIDSLFYFLPFTIISLVDSLAY